MTTAKSISRIIAAALVLSAGGSCAADPAAPPAPLRAYAHVGTIQYKPVAECSGIVASRKHPGVFWVHSDGGNAAALYAIDKQGKLLAEFPVGAPNVDWEDVALDDAGRLYLADVGNNGARRKQVTVYRLDEPDPAAPAPPGRAPRRLPVTATWTLTFPAAPFDCEALFVHEGFGYVVSKLFLAQRADLYRFPLDETDKPVALEKVLTLPVRAAVTAADLSADGKRLALLTVAGLNVFDIDGDVDRAAKAEPRFWGRLQPNMEAACFAEGGVLVATEARDLLWVPLDEEADENDR